MGSHLCVVAGCVGLSLTAVAGAVDPIFSDQTAAAGVTASHATSGFSQLGYAGGGAVGDFNNDGWQDFFFISGGSNSAPDKLFINNGNGTFTNQAAAWGLTVLHKGKSACVGDFDNDGWLDLYVTSAGPTGQNAAPGHHKLYRNNGNGTFTNVATTAGVAFADPTGESAWTATFGDYDLDGDLDLWVGGFAGSPSNSENRLFRNNLKETGSATFTDVTSSIGFWTGVGPVANLSARFLDMDGDRYPELLLGGDFKGAGSYIGSRLFKNDGDGTFTDKTTVAGTGHEENGMGQTVLDFNNDQRFDWYVTSIYQLSSGWTGNKLYRNIGNLTFSEMSVVAAVEKGGYGWGAVGVDVNHDGFEDIAETSGDASSGSPFYAIPARLFVNNGNLTFTDKATASGFVHTVKGRAMLRLDYDNDGDQDILIFRNTGALTLFRNDLPAGPATSWLRVFLSTGGSDDLAPNGIGAKLYATVGGTTRMRSLDSGVSFLGTSELSAHFGLGTATVIDQLKVVWANGAETILTNVPVNQTITIASTVPCDADLTGDGAVLADDLAIALGAWGSAGPGDLDGSGVVDGADVGALLGAWGDCP
jgi:hypothetical protein